MVQVNAKIEINLMLEPSLVIIYCIAVAIFSLLGFDVLDVLSLFHAIYISASICYLKP
jgi:hypothetical protein